MPLVKAMGRIASRTADRRLVHESYPMVFRSEHCGRKSHYESGQLVHATNIIICQCRYYPDVSIVATVVAFPYSMVRGGALCCTIGTRVLFIFTVTSLVSTNIFNQTYPPVWWKTRLRKTKKIDLRAFYELFKFGFCFGGP